MAKLLLASVCLLLAATAWAAPARLATRAQVEALLSQELPSGSSPAMVAQFLDAHGVDHGEPEKSGASVIMVGTFRKLQGSAPAASLTLLVQFSFLQNRLIGYSFTETSAKP